jgi:hypothetical protein
MKVTVYSITWDIRNAQSRLGTELFATEAQRDAGLLEMVRSYGIEVASMDEFYSDRVNDELNACDADIIVDDHYLDIPIPAEITP